MDAPTVQQHNCLPYPSFKTKPGAKTIRGAENCKRIKKIPPAQVTVENTACPCPRQARYCRATAKYGITLVPLSLDEQDRTERQRRH